MPKSKVYFLPVKEGEAVAAIAQGLKRLLDESGLLNHVAKDLRVAMKMHFGEEGNTGFVNPEFVKVVCAAVAAKGAQPFLAETNTLYRGRRTNSKDHLAIAREHGFSEETIGAKVVIPDDCLKENSVDIPINRKFIKTAHIARVFYDADMIIGLSHFKGHIMTGFGAALKNIGMGCATRVGKLRQHSDVSPVVYKDKCTGCGECVKACPVDAITLVNEKSVIDAKLCIGCATCIAVCPFTAIDVNWESGGNRLSEKMVEYASAVMKDKPGRMLFVNFAVKITKECDCLAKDDPRVSPDIGIFACDDPVSVDKASFDRIIKACGRNIFAELHPNRDSLRQLEYAEQLGLGSMDYELITNFPLPK